MKKITAYHSSFFNIENMPYFILTVVLAFKYFKSTLQEQIHILVFIYFCSYSSNLWGQYDFLLFEINTCIQ